MPNWCNNTIEISHEDPAMIERARAAFKEGKFLNEFVPVPEELHIVAGCVGEKGSPEQNELEAKEKANREKYGYTTWYDFCVNEWGTKWDVGGDDYNEPTISEDGCKMTASFDSAWAPPCNAYEKMLDLGFSIRATYYEPGMAFAGLWEDGYDDFYELGGMGADEVAETLPSELDDQYGISECIREYEDENKDELEIWYEEGVEKKGLEPHSK